MEKEFIELIVKIGVPEFLGVATILKAPMRDENGKPREAADIIVDATERFCRLGRKQKRELLAVMRKSLKQKVRHDIK